MFLTFTAFNASCSLSQLWNSAIVAYQVGPSGFTVAVVSAACYDVSIVDAFVIVQQNGRDVDAVWTWHAVFTVVAWDCRIFLHYGGCLLKEL